MITPALHNKIRRLYTNKSCHSGEVKKFAEKHGLPRWKISRYAQEMGWSAKHKKQPDWTEQELRILKQSAHCSPHTIQKRLKDKGFERSLVGIVLKRKRMRFLSNLNGHSAQSVALCLGEDVHFVLKHIKLGNLKAKRREMNRTPQQGGNNYYIKDKDIKNFIINNIHIIDIRKADKYWFVDLLTNSH